MTLYSGSREYKKITSSRAYRAIVNARRYVYTSYNPASVSAALAILETARIKLITAR